MVDIDRRRVVGGLLGALGVSATGAFGRFGVLAQGPGAVARQRIDVHHHFAPPAWLVEVKGRPMLQAANTTWTPAKSIEDMDRGGVAASVISVTNPGLWFGDVAVTQRLARNCNDFGAKLVLDYPRRFGLFAAMPMPDVDSTLTEIAYAYDTLKADGVSLFTNYGDTWLGNPTYRPVMEELNRRRAVVHVHPSAANCCRNLDYAQGISPNSIEYGTDTTRAIIGVTVNGDAVRYPNITFIWSHAGGTAPFLAGRIANAANQNKASLPNGFIAELKKFYYDLAGASNAGAIASLLTIVDSSKILFGTDFPPGGSAADYVKALRELRLFSEADLKAIDLGNAVRLLPRLRPS